MSKTNQLDRVEITKKTLLTTILIMLAVLANTKLLDQVGETYVDKALERSLVTFAVARGINGIISVAQGTEVALQPAGLGVNFTPGQILDPINDLVERFSWLMLASSIALGIQKLLLEMSAAHTLNVIIIVLIVFQLYVVWRPSHIAPKLSLLNRRILVVILVARFSVALTAISAEWAFHYFMSETYAQSQEQLLETKNKITQLTLKDKEVRNDTDLPIMDRAKQFINSVTDTMDIEAHIEEYQLASREASQHTINLIVVFIMQTILIPILFLLCVYYGLVKSSLFSLDR